jgi:Fic family protein
MIKNIISSDYIKKIGAGAGVRYVRGGNFYLAPLPVENYFQNDQKNRIIFPGDTFLSKTFKSFSELEKKEMEELKKMWQRKYAKASDTIRNKEMERITIELSWKSSQIEGNTYSLLDTERLIKESKEAEGHDHSEAIMILNHKNVLKFILENRSYFKDLSRLKIEELHNILLKDLNVSSGLRKSGVGIVGTDYKPLDNIYQLNEQLEDFINLTKDNHDTLDKVFACMVCVAYMQPFEDGNKRTSRMLANAILLANDYPPISFRSIDELEYKKAIILCYESKNIHYMKKLFMEQYKEACLGYFG